MFNTFGKILPGGLLIYHGLIVAVEDRIAPYFLKIMENLYIAMKFDFNLTDEYSMRNACGLVSDIGNNLKQLVVN
jgi:hypothetical protein